MFFDESIKDVYLRLNSSEKGLTSVEAQDRLSKQGLNEIDSGKKISIFKLFINQFKNFLVILLIFAALLSLVTKDIPEFFGIISIVLLSVILGFVQEYRAEKAMEALKKISAPFAKVCTYLN